MTDHTADDSLPEGIGGYVESGFGAVADAFAANFERGDVGASCSLWVGGRPVVDLWGGIADPRNGRPWTADTVAILFSITKGVSSICAQLLVERGLLDLDALVTEYWPEYGAAGKEHTTVRHVLSHRTGLPVIDGEVTLDDLADHAGMAARMAAQTPLFEPGTTHAYQAVTFSWTFGELFRRVAGESIGTFLAREVVEPYGLELWLGLPPELEPRVAPILPVDVPEELVLAFLPPGSLPWRAMTINGLMPVKIVGDGIGLNDPTFHHLELAAANGISNARALAKLHAAVIGEVDGRPPLLRPETVAAASVVQSSGQGFGDPVPGASWGPGSCGRSRASHSWRGPRSATTAPAGRSPSPSPSVASPSAMWPTRWWSRWTRIPAPGPSSTRWSPAPPDPRWRPRSAEPLPGEAQTVSVPLDPPSEVEASIAVLS